MRVLHLVPILVLMLAGCLSSEDSDVPPAQTADPTPAATATPTAAPRATTATLPSTSTATAPAESPLNGTAWRLIELLSDAVDPVFGVTLEFRNGRVEGYSGCNDFSAAFHTAESDSIVIEAVATNEEGCPAPLHELNFQARYYDALTVSVRYILSSRGQLALQHTNGETLLIFEPLDAAAGAHPTLEMQPPAEPTPTTPIATYGNWEIYVMNADGSDQHRPAPSLAGESRPAWMPDGRLSFFSGRTGEERVFAVWPDGTGLEDLSIDGSAFTSWVEWSADGSQIYYASNIDSLEQLYVADADGSNPRRITEIANGTSYPDWSPDGSKVVFTNGSHGPAVIYVVNADGSGLQRLTFDQEATEESPVWSPDGSQIAFAHHPNEGSGGIFIMDDDGNNLRRLTTSEPWIDGSPAWSPDGRKIAFGRAGDIWVINVDGANLTRLADDPHHDEHPVWSPDGSKIAFISNRDGGQPVECSFLGINDYMGIESLDQLAWMSEMIVVGEVVERFPSAFGTVQDDGLTGAHYPIYTDYLIEVDAWVRGAPAPTVRLRQTGGTVGACTQVFDSEPVVEVGDRLLLFLLYDELNTDLPTAGFAIGGFQGFWPVDEDSATVDQQFSLPAGTPVEEITTMIREILRRPEPDFFGLVPLDEAPLVEAD